MIQVGSADRPVDLETTIAIIGSGFSGLGMAIQLRKRGDEDFLIFEKASDIGGTWRDNTYPGCGSDVPTSIYSYSFEQNPYWSKMWSSQPEIQAYLQGLTDKYDLRRKVIFNTQIVSAHWDETISRWILRSANGHRITAQFMVIGTGLLHQPHIPAFDGIESFEGAMFHSARWDHSVDLAGKKVAVIGTGASAIQIVPAIAEQVGQLQLYQRTPPWVLGRKNWAMPKLVQQIFAQMPLIRGLFRFCVYLVAELLCLGLYGPGKLHKVLEWAAKANIRKNIQDPELVAKLTPNYRIGCKRLLFSPSYYPALARSNTELVTNSIAEVRPQSIVTDDGIERNVDVIIYATGFQIGNRFEGLEIFGIGDESLTQRWEIYGDQAHLGVTVTGMPNMFLMLGPNSVLTHNSVVFMIEQQIKYVLYAIDQLRQSTAAAIEVSRDTQNQFNEHIQRQLATKIWSNGGCTSWFLDSKGTNRILWPGFSWQYWQAIRQFDDLKLVSTESQ
ncbi:4-hydroxyacetophenone monooxygenase [Mycobacteroides franklinii]|uniref:4-hydroxyacetophenone monooxygenase n=1 Tax=Mycobacteroides franklinii TaxID=948102 RepID=A0A1S1L6U3_9MYCO|nr:NAD(P)/FAD-dependent oxidoreductase [Mycobacteroides franklinii]OHU21546.1 4-hydroxyacetophenone monooxygenase [Mycobacteroides franklinii]